MRRVLPSGPVRPPLGRSSGILPPTPPRSPVGEAGLLLLSGRAGLDRAAGLFLLPEPCRVVTTEDLTVWSFGTLRGGNGGRGQQSRHAVPARGGLTARLLSPSIRPRPSR